MFNLPSVCRNFHRTHLAPLERELRTPSTYALMAILIAVAAGSRLADIMPNFTAVGAVAMFGAFVFRSRVLAMGAPTDVQQNPDVVRAYIGGEA